MCAKSVQKIEKAYDVLITPHLFSNTDDEKTIFNFVLKNIAIYPNTPYFKEIPLPNENAENNEKQKQKMILMLKWISLYTRSLNFKLPIYFSLIHLNELYMKILSNNGDLSIEEFFELNYNSMTYLKHILQNKFVKSFYQILNNYWIKFEKYRKQILIKYMCLSELNEKTSFKNDSIISYYYYPILIKNSLWYKHVKQINNLRWKHGATLNDLKQIYANQILNTFSREIAAEKINQLNMAKNNLDLLGVFFDWKKLKSSFQFLEIIDTKAQLIKEIEININEKLSFNTLHFNENFFKNIEKIKNELMFFN